MRDWGAAEWEFHASTYWQPNSKRLHSLKIESWRKKILSIGSLSSPGVCITPYNFSPPPVPCNIKCDCKYLMSRKLRFIRESHIVKVIWERREGAVGDPLECLSIIAESSCSSQSLFAVQLMSYDLHFPTHSFHFGNSFECFAGRMWRARRRVGGWPQSEIAENVREREGGERGWQREREMLGYLCFMPLATM